MFFKKKKASFDSQKPTEIKNAVNITCPSCGHEQTESKIAFSTNCKKCSTYFKIEGGKAIAPQGITSPIKTYQAPEKDANDDTETDSQPRLKVRKESPFQEEVKKQLEETKENPSEEKTEDSQAKEPESTPKRFVPVREPEKEDAPSGLFGKSKVKTREVSCFECDKVHQAPAEASSTNCPQCGTYITLKDFDIREQWNQRIQTRGNVTIHKKAAVTGVTIHCHDLLVYGKFTGGVNCSGDFTLNSHGKIMGAVNCKRLIIEKKANVEFSNHVYAEEVIIDGSVTGHFTCTGKLQLKKKATITGDITVATMTMEEGAKHNGRMSIGQ